MKILIWGCGNMASAFAQGLQRGFPEAQFVCWNPSKAKALSLAADLGGVVLADLDAPVDVDVVVLGFKPQVLAEAKLGLLKVLSPGALVVSLLAAVPLATLRQHFTGHSILRVMPNLAVAHGAGVVLWSGYALTPAVQDKWQASLSAMGLAPHLTEELIDVYTLHAGCSPAFLYQWIDDAARFATLNGGEAELSRQILVRTWLGALQSLATETSSMPEMIARVASKGGVTQAALDGFSQRASDYIMAGFTAGLKRIKELR